MKYSLIAIIGFVLSSVLSCDKESSYIKEQMYQLHSRSIIIPYNSMLRLSDETSKYYSQPSLPKLRIIIFSDSNSCSECLLHSMSEWNIFLDLERDNQLGMTFIFDYPKQNIKSFLSLIKGSGLEHCVYVDTASCFLKVNPHIPDNPMFHTFMIDRNDSVVVVGDPARNMKVRELMYRIINANEK